jgi:sugar O-acyltransferase (sialic acid O-acetyltransferase NeuD family)
VANQALYGLVGAGGFGREVMPLARSQLASRLVAGEARLAFVVEDEPSGREVNGTPVISMGEFLAHPGERHFNIAIAASAARARIASLCEAAGARPYSIIASNVVIQDGVELGEGAILCPFVMLLSNVRVGRYFHANIYSYIAHDCVIGDFVTFAPRVACNGRSRVEDEAYVGTGAVMREGAPGAPLIVGAGAVVGMGAVVTRDVAPLTTVIGNPARPLAEKPR